MGFMIVAWLSSILYLVLFLRQSDVRRYMKWIASLSNSPRAAQFDSRPIVIYLRLFFAAGLTLSLTFAIWSSIVLLRR